MQRAQRARAAAQQQPQVGGPPAPLAERAPPRTRDGAATALVPSSGTATAPRSVAELRDADRYPPTQNGGLQHCAPMAPCLPPQDVPSQSSVTAINRLRELGSVSTSTPLPIPSVFDFSYRPRNPPPMPPALLGKVSGMHKASLPPTKRASPEPLSEGGIAQTSDGDQFSSPPSVPPLVSMVQGRFYVPITHSKRKSVSCAAKRAAHDSTAYVLSRDASLSIPPGINRARNGIINPNDEPVDEPTSSAAQKERARHNEVERTLSIFSLGMVQALLPYTDDERKQMQASGKSLLEEEETARVRVFLADKAARHLASMSNARRALLALYDYAQHVGINLVGFNASVGLISAFLSSQVARTMAASRLRGLVWAQLNYSIAITANSPALQSYLEKRGSGANHATTMPVKVACHLAVLASDSTRHEYTRAVAAGLYLLATASLRWADAQRSTWRPLSGTLEGSGETKTGFAFWWGEKSDLLGGTDWFRPLTKSYKTLTSPPDYIFRRALFERGKTGSLEGFQGWGEGPARKSHVVKSFQEILMMEPLSLSEDEAKALSRIHGARRMYPTLGRYLSHELNLSTDDRQELGRWAPSSGGSSSHAAPMANLYSTDAQRARCVATRKRVADAARRLIRDAGWTNLPLDGGGFEAFIQGGVNIAEPEPDMSSDESEDEAEIEI